MVSIMKKRSIFLFIILILAVLIGFIGTASAQNIDIDDMDNEQLMLLLQSIMQKLESDEAPDTDARNTEGTETTVNADTSSEDEKEILTESVTTADDLNLDGTGFGALTTYAKGAEGLDAAQFGYLLRAENGAVADGDVVYHLCRALGGDAYAGVTADDFADADVGEFREESVHVILLAGSADGNIHIGGLADYCLVPDVAHVNV